MADLTFFQTLTRSDKAVREAKREKMQEQITLLDKVGEGVASLARKAARDMRRAVESSGDLTLERAVLRLQTRPCDKGNVPSWCTPEEAGVLTDANYEVKQLIIPLCEIWMHTLGGTLEMRRLPVDADQTIIEVRAERLVLPCHSHNENETILMLDGEMTDAVTGISYRAGSRPIFYARGEQHAPCAESAHYLMTFSPRLPSHDRPS